MRFIHKLKPVLNMVSVKREINQQDFRMVDLHFVTSA